MLVRRREAAGSTDGPANTGSRRCDVSAHELSVLRSQPRVPLQGRRLNEQPSSQVGPWLQPS